MQSPVTQYIPNRHNIAAIQFAKIVFPPLSVSLVAQNICLPANLMQMLQNKQINEVHKLNHPIPSALKQTKEHQLKPSYNHLAKK